MIFVPLIIGGIFFVRHAIKNQYLLNRHYIAFTKQQP